MENAKETRWAEPAAWITTLGNLLPFWLLSFVVMAEGFPRPPISGEVTIASFVTAIAASIALVWKRWMTVELLLYSLFPLLLLCSFDEISTTYKTPFIILCTLS